MSCHVLVSYRYVVSCHHAISLSCHVLSSSCRHVSCLIVVMLSCHVISYRYIMSYHIVVISYHYMVILLCCTITYTYNHTTSPAPSPIPMHLSVTPLHLHLHLYTHVHHRLYHLTTSFTYITTLKALPHLYHLLHQYHHPYLHHLNLQLHQHLHLHLHLHHISCPLILPPMRSDIYAPTGSSPSSPDVTTWPMVENFWEKLRSRILIKWPACEASASREPGFCLPGRWEKRLTYPER